MSGNLLERACSHMLSQLPTAVHGPSKPERSAWQALASRFSSKVIGGAFVPRSVADKSSSERNPTVCAPDRATMSLSVKPCRLKTENAKHTTSRNATYRSLCFEMQGGCEGLWGGACLRPENVTKVLGIFVAILTNQATACNNSKHAAHGCRTCVAERCILSRVFC